MIKAISGLVLVNAFSQVVQLGAQPFLARLYSPEQFGLLAQLTVISSIISIFGTVQLHNYLVLANDDRDMCRMVGAGIALTNIICLVSLPILVVTSSEVYGPETDVGLPILTCLMVLTSCYGSLLRGIQTALGRFRCMMRYLLVRASVLVAAQVACGLENIENGLIYGLLIGEVCAQIAVCTKLLNLIGGISLSQAAVNARHVFRTHREFIVAGTLQELVSLAVFMVPLYLMSRVYGNAAGGQYAMAHKMGWAPILLLAQAISPVFMKYASAMNKPDLHRSAYLNLHVFFAVFIFCSTISLLAVEPLFLAIFGATWSVAASICAWVGVLSASFIAALPFRICYRILNRQRIQLLIDAVALVLVGIIFYFSPHFSLVEMAQAVVGIGVVQNATLSVVAKRYLQFVENGSPRQVSR